jgi:hypothetical protein
MAQQKLKIPPRERARYSLLDSARKEGLGGVDWSKGGLVVCDDPCTDAFFFAPYCDKFIQWADLGTATKPQVDMQFTATGPGAATAIWDFGDESPPPTAGAVVTHRYNQPGRYYVSCLIAATGGADERFQIWPIDVGDEECGDCRQIDPISLFSEVFSVGPFNLDEMIAAAKESLEATASAALERAAWTGYGLHSPSLVEAGLPIINNAGTGGLQTLSVAAAMAGLEEQLASAEGTIHMSIRAANLLWRDHLLVKDNDRLYTAIGGHLVIAGTGYDTHQGPANYVRPDGKVDNTDSLVVGDFGWMVAHSGPVWVWRDGKVEIIENFDTKLNRMTVRAQQSAAVVWRGCRQVAALADLGC